APWPARSQLAADPCRPAALDLAAGLVQDAPEAAVELGLTRRVGPLELAVQVPELAGAVGVGHPQAEGRALVVGDGGVGAPELAVTGQLAVEAVRADPPGRGGAGGRARG